MTTFTYEDLIAWSERLPLWQRDALRRLLRRGELSEIDVAELANLAQAPDSAGAGPAATPASVDDVQPSAASMPAVSLIGVREIARVNALSAGPIRFAADGLTVVYGANASGKSGIARILKKACRARAPGGEIRPNVFEPEPSEPPTATIDFRVDRDERNHTWVEGGVSDSDLAMVNVFDSTCADVQVGKPNRISYTPDILAVFRDLALACDRVAETLRSRKTGLGLVPGVLNELQLGTGTCAGRFVRTLHAGSDLDELSRLCTLAETDDERLRELERALSDDPVVKAQVEAERERRVQRREELSRRALEVVSDRACEALAARLNEAKEADAAASAARVLFSRNSELGGVGADAWRRLWEAARRFSEEEAYVGEAFPVVRDGAVCVLCQQPLRDGAAVRLQSFEEFVKDDVQQRADEATAKRADAIAVIRGLSLPRCSRDASLEGTEEGRALRSFLVAAKLRRRHLLRMASGETAGQRPALPPQPKLAGLRERIREEANRFRRASRAAERVGMQRERDELSDRFKLAPLRETIRQELDRLQAVKQLNAAISDCKTNQITLKSGEAAGLIITGRLRSCFAKNLADIGFSETPVDVELGAGEYGAHPYQVALMARGDVPPQEVLSEGERTCVALAGFLAELETTENRSGIVLDDPVSSLDHRYRKRVAERLVREAKRRQIIILTHDVILLFLVRKYASKLGVPMQELSLLRGYKGNHGVAEDGPPWVAMSVGQRMGRLQKELQAARAVLNQGDQQTYEQKASWIYDHLRQSWERAVEEVLLNRVVLRFADGVETQRLKNMVDISEQDVQHVDMEMTRCSGFVHDEAGPVYGGIPGPETIASDIRKLDDWVKDLRKNRKRN